MKRFFAKHHGYTSVVWGISLWISGIWAFVSWIKALFDAAGDGNVFAFVVLFVSQAIFLGISAFLGAVMLFIVLLLISVIPYLIVRGLISN